jgi:NAD dependent epimerase/dehydratase family enzyme
MVPYVPPSLREERNISVVSCHGVEWDGRKAGTWEHCLADTVVNLSGAPIADGRWTDAR